MSAEQLTTGQNSAAHPLQKPRAISPSDEPKIQKAILDEHGTILSINSAWEEFVVRNPAWPDASVGANYLSLCRNAAGPFGDKFETVEVGVRAVLRGDQEVFLLEYPSPSHAGKQWHLVRASRFAGKGVVLVVVSHEDIPEARLHDTERQNLVSLIEYSTDFIAFATLSGEILY